VATDPVALHQYALVNAAASDALRSIVFPTIGSWHGVAGRVFQDRVEALVRRRNQLKEAHDRAASALRSLALTAQQTQEEMEFRRAQRAEAVERRSRIDAMTRQTIDPAELRRLQHERDSCEHDIRIADRAYAKADEVLQSAEKKCVHDIDQLARLDALEPLAERIGHLSLTDFVAYKGLVKAKTIPDEGLNWTSDGCSDDGRVTGNVNLPACQLHDFGYRNHDKTRDSWWLDKQKADARLAQEMARDAANDFPSILAGGPTQIIGAVGQVGVVWLGAEVLGRPDAATTDERKKTKAKSRDK
jgi:uncharacterized protein YukE